MTDSPTVGIVVVNFHGDERTLACLDALARSTWPLHRLVVAVVDNGSSIGFADEVRRRPGVIYLHAGDNIGFPAACNIGIRELADSCEFIGLLNNDATPTEGWLQPLIEAIERDGRIGGVTPRIVLTGRFIRLQCLVPTERAGAGDARDLGVQLSGVRVGGRDLTPDIQLGAGFWGWEEGQPAGRFAWTSAEARALVRLGDDIEEDELVGPVEVRLSSVLSAVRVIVHTEAGNVAIDVTGPPAWYEVAPRLTPVRLLNSTGIELRADLRCGDRDYFEPDQASEDAREDTFACSGAAVLFRRDFLRDVGPMDERFFLYYEDVDLCWRGRLRGWRFRYVAGSTVFHEHSATVGSGSRLAAHLAERNRLLTLMKSAPAGVVLAALRQAGVDLVRALGNDVIRPAFRGRRSRTEHVARMGRVLLGFVRLAPYAVSERRAIGRRSTVDRRRAMVPT